MTLTQVLQRAKVGEVVAVDKGDPNLSHILQYFTQSPDKQGWVIQFDTKGKLVWILYTRENIND